MRELTIREVEQVGGAIGPLAAIAYGGLLGGLSGGLNYTLSNPGPTWSAGTFTGRVLQGAVAGSLGSAAIGLLGVRGAIVGAATLAGSAMLIGSVGNVSASSQGDGGGSY